MQTRGLEALFFERSSLTMAILIQQTFIQQTFIVKEDRGRIHSVLVSTGGQEGFGCSKLVIEVHELPHWYENTFSLFWTCISDAHEACRCFPVPGAVAQLLWSF